MKGSQKVVDILNEALASELTAINQYFLHAEMQENWGYERLSHLVKRSSMDEMRHAEALMERILYLDGLPNMRLLKIRAGADVKAQLEGDLAAEKEAIDLYNRGAQLCREEGDHGTKDLFERLLVNEEQHADWLEAQLGLIEQVGLELYLSQQIRGNE
jgi:bacterioferritin